MIGRNRFIWNASPLALKRLMERRLQRTAVRLDKLAQAAVEGRAC